jgi:hypothetical protein
MNQKNVDNQPEQKTPDTFQTPAPSEYMPDRARAEKTQPGRLRRFLRNALIWLVVFVFVFMAGFVTDHYLRYKPLQNELNTTKAHLELLQVKADVSNARLALSLNDVAGAKAALTNTQQRLDDLLLRITTFNPALGQSMPQRFNLIISDLQTNPATAKVDLELFSKDLLKVEAALFSN